MITLTPFLLDKIIENAHINGARLYKRVGDRVFLRVTEVEIRFGGGGDCIVFKLNGTEVLTVDSYSREHLMKVLEQLTLDPDYPTCKVRLLPVEMTTS